MSDTRKSNPRRKVPEPDQRALTKIQAERLGELASVAPDTLVGKKIAAVNELLKFTIDPELLFFRRVCGRVVKEDPATGELWGVPNATVHVEDTDCSFLGLFPSGPWGWLFPSICRREEIATAITDECGNFCVLIPRWEIDYILRWKRVRLCVPDLLRARLRDVLPIDPHPPIIRDPRPQPDPAPFRIDLDRVREVAGVQAAARLEQFQTERTFASPLVEVEGALATPTLPLPPPKLPGIGNLPRKEMVEALAERLPVERALLERIDFDRYVGPFWKCHDVFYPEFVPLFDVPDITFRVTQDVDGDGDEEVIYSEGYFEVRWNAGPIPDVELRASGNALATPICDGPDIDPGACSEPTIVTVGLMPLEASYHDSTTGYALRLNKPRPGGFSDSPQASPAQAPYLGTLQLHGCHRFDGAQFYRFVYAYAAASPVPFVGLDWYTPLLDGSGNLHVVPDPNGWYDILPPGNLVFPHWLLNWPTPRFADGRYVVRLELGDAAKNVIDQSAPVAFEVDNSRPLAIFEQLRWRVQGTGAGGWATLDTACPVIRRPVSDPIDIEVRYTAGATHFRDVVLGASGCDPTAVITRAGVRADYEHWHVDPTDNNLARTALFEVPAGSTEGPYTLTIFSRGRGFNPAGSDAGPGTDWNYDPAYARFYPNRSICIINV